MTHLCADGIPCTKGTLPEEGCSVQADAMGRPPYGMGAGRQLGAMECSLMAHTQTLLAAPQD